MAQCQYTTYQADVESYTLRDALPGVLKPGRFSGYDAMSENTIPVGGVIVLDWDHNNIAKYDTTNPTPILEATRGIAVTTQGTIIADDLTVTESLTFINHASGGFHILYMEHAYLSGTAGANPATYGIISGTGGGGLPVLSSATKQVIIGVIKEAANGAVFGDLTYYPAPAGYGDVDILTKLFQITDDGDWDMGTMPVSEEGIIGNRLFGNNNYLTDYTSITEALDDLDGALKSEEDARIAVGNRALDNINWGALSDNLNHNASAAAHGLLPKLPITDGDNYYLQGTGDWVVKSWGRIVMRSGSFDNDVTVAAPDPDTGSYDFSGIAPADADTLILRIYLMSYTSQTAGNNGGIYFRKASSGGFNAMVTHQVETAVGSFARYFQVHVPCTSAQLVYYSLLNRSMFDQISISCVGWQTYLI